MAPGLLPFERRFLIAVMRFWPTKRRSIWVLLSLSPLVGVAQNWSALLNNNPFYTPPPPPPPVEPAQQLELRGVVKQQGSYLLNVYDQTTKKSWWMMVGETEERLLARGYDPKREVATLEKQGKLLSIALRASSVRGGDMIAQATRMPVNRAKRMPASPPAQVSNVLPVSEVQRLAGIAEEIRQRREQRRRGSG
jgi:hypothetical protein